VTFRTWDVAEVFGAQRDGGGVRSPTWRKKVTRDLCSSRGKEVEQELERTLIDLVSLHLSTSKRDHLLPKMVW